MAKRALLPVVVDIEGRPLPASFYELLGVQPDEPAAGIRKAYLRKCTLAEEFR